MKRNSWLHIILALVLIVVAFAGVACAEDSEDLDFVFTVEGPNPSEILNFKDELYKNGFYPSTIGEDKLLSTELDEITMAAVSNVCEYNPDLPYSADGVIYRLYFRVMGEDGEPLNTPLNAEGYQSMEQGATGPAVGKLQTRLSDLGYDEKAGFSYTPSVYDEEMQSAIEAFLECNAYYDYEAGSGVSAELMEFIYSDEAKEYSNADQPLSERLLGYLTAKSAIVGVEVPNFVLLLIGFALLCGVVILIMRLVAPNKGKAGSAGKLRFKIEYNGETAEIVEDMGSSIQIGRSVGNFPLNIKDESISRKHCEIICEKGRLSLKDHSSFGTKLNGKMCHNERMPIKSGDVLEVGKHRITVYVEK